MAIFHNWQHIFGGPKQKKTSDIGNIQHKKERKCINLTLAVNLFTFKGFKYGLNFRSISRFSFRFELEFPFLIKLLINSG